MEQSIVLNRKQLLKSLKKLKHGIFKYSPVAIMECILFEFRTGDLVMTTFNNDLEVKETIVYENNIAFINSNKNLFVIDFYWLYKVINFSKGDTVEIPLSSMVSTSIIFKIKRAVHNYVFDREAHDFPASMKAIELNYRICLNQSIRDAIKRALNFISSDDLRPSMTGVLIQYNEKMGGLYIVATDAHCMYMENIDTNEEPINDHAKKMLSSGIILSKPLSVMLSKYCDNGKDLIFNEYIVETRGSDCSKVFGRLIDGRFPNWESVLPKGLIGSDTNIIFDRAELIEILKIAESISNKATFQIFLSFSNKDSEVKIIVKAESVLQSNSNFTMPCLINNVQDFSISFNCKFLLKSLQQHKCKEAILYTTGVPTKASIIDDKILIMPMIINN